MQPSLTLHPALPGFCPVTDAVEVLASTGGVEERGAIYTRAEVVDFILDLVGYTTDAPLLSYRLLEPSFGDGDFLLRVVDRLLVVAVRTPGGLVPENLGPAIRAVELHHSTFAQTRTALIERLLRCGLSDGDAAQVVDQWLRQGDFLLLPLAETFTHVVGNPPYVRQESVPDVLMREYRLRYKTIYDRADLYVPFIERSLDLLELEGRCGFICADRWMKNRYGQKLRDKVQSGFALDVYVDMVGTDAFHSEVSAYPAVTVIRRGRPHVTRAAANPTLDRATLATLARDLRGESADGPSGMVRVEDAVSASGPWVFDAAEEMILARRLQATFPALEAAGCKVGIGVATGADQAFIGLFEELDVEPSRKLPLAMTKDLVAGRVEWRGLGVVNPFGEDGRLVDLADYPKFAAHIQARKSVIAKRHVAEKAPHNWYRTIDRIYPEIAAREKLLVPDIRGESAFVYEPGQLYPHHNLYYIVSDTWNLHALRAVLQAGIAKLFVSLYSTKMRGGYLRFQAQNLRRIHLPRWDQVPEHARAVLVREGREAQVSPSALYAVAEIYGLSPDELTILRTFA